MSALLARALRAVHEPREKGRCRKDLRFSAVDAAMYSVMVALGETYISAFALALGMGQIAAGLMGSAPMIAGGLLQLAAPYAVAKLGSNRRWVVACTLVQALAFVPLILGAIHGSMPAALVFLFTSAYWAAGNSAGPAWNVWIETLVPKRIHARYFAKRARFAHGSYLGALLIGGTALELASKLGHPLYGFAVTFALACGARITSSRALAHHSEPEPYDRNTKRVSLTAIIPKLRHAREGRVLVFLIAMQVAVNISGPYFTPYWLGHLHFSYAEHMLLQAIAFFAKLIAAPLFGEVARRTGAHRLLKITGFAVVPISGLYIFSDAYPWQIAVQICSGLAWSGYELATLLILFDAFPREERTSLLSLHNFAHACALVTGSIIGALIAGRFDDLAHAYVALFVCSTGGRALATLLLRRIPDGSRFAPALHEARR